MVKIDLDGIESREKDVYERAKVEAGIFIGDFKVTDAEYYPQKDEIEFERRLRQKNRKLLLIYLSLKIIFISSKFKPTIIKESIFKWVCVGNSDFLWDVRIVAREKSSQYWQSSGMQALEVKLKKTMSMI